MRKIRKARRSNWTLQLVTWQTLTTLIEWGEIHNHPTNHVCQINQAFLYNFSCICWKTWEGLSTRLLLWSVPTPMLLVHSHLIMLIGVPELLWPKLLFLAWRWGLVTIQENSEEWTEGGTRPEHRSSDVEVIIHPPDTLTNACYKRGVDSEWPLLPFSVVHPLCQR